MTEFEKKLTEFFDNADEKQLGLLDVFPEEKLTNRACESIFSSAVRKAGIDMQENKTIKRTGKRSKRFIGLAAAAAVLATGAISAGAYAYTQFINRQNVDRFLGDATADKLEDAGLVLNSVRENEHVRLTADTAISDGRNAQIVFKLEKLDDISRKLLAENSSWDCDFCYADTGESWIEGENNYGIGSGGENFINFGDFTYSKKFLLDLSDTDTTRPIKAQNFRVYDPRSGEDIACDLFDGFEFEFDLSKNVETAVLTSAEGNELIMSPFAVWGSVDKYSDFFDMEEPDYTDVERLHASISMIRADGTREPLTLESSFKGGGEVRGGKNDDGSNFFRLVRSFYDIDDYIGIEIEGVEYLKR